MSLNMLVAQFFAVLFSFLTIWLPHTTLHAFHVELANDVADIISSKRILLRFSFDGSDSALYRDSLRFSSDCSDLALTSWQSSVPASSEYIVSFKQNKLVYKESLLIDVQCMFDYSHLKQHVNSLKDSSIYVACLLLGSDGKNKSRSLVVPLGYSGVFTEKKQAIVLTQRDDNILLNDFVTSATMTMTMHQYGNGVSLSTVEDDNSLVDEDAVMFDKLLSVWNYVAMGVYAFLDSTAFLFLYMLMFLMVILFLFKRIFPVIGYILPFSGVLALEFERFCGFVVLGSACNFLRYFIPGAAILGGLALYFFVVSLYYLRSTPYSDTFLGKLKVLLGMFLVAMVLPLLLKAYLLQQVAFLNTLR